MWTYFSEPLERRTLLAGGPTPPDLSPLSIPNLVFDNGVFKATNPTISFNGTPTISLQGSVTVSSTTISATGQVSAAFGGNQILFGGNFSIPVGQAATDALSDTLGIIPNRLQLGGTTLEFQNFTLGAASVQFNAKAKLPAALGSFELNATQVMLGASGISVATIGVNDPNSYMFDVGGFKLNASSLSATYDVAGEKVKLTGMFNAPQLNTTVDLSGNKFLAVGSGPSIEFVGGVSIAGPVTIGGPWKLNSLNLQISYQNNDFTTSGTGVVDTGGGNLIIQAQFQNSRFSFSVAGAAMFNVLGMEFTLSTLTFTSDESGGGMWDPKVEAQGSLKLPQQFGNFTVAIQGGNKLTVDSTGVSLTGATLSLPGNQTFTILNLLEVKTQNATLSFDFQNSEMKLQGTYVVPALNDLQVNLSGNNFAALKFDNGLDFAFMGSFTNINIPIFGGWALQNGSVTINKPYGTVPGDITGSFDIKTPNNTAINLALAFLNGRLSEITATNNNTNPDFTFFGVSAKVTKVKFIPDINPANDDQFEPQLELQGSVSLPTSFGTVTGGAGGPVTFTVADPEKFILNESSITLSGGSISIPAVNFNLLGLVKVSAQSLNVQFISTPAPQKLRISGIVKIPQLFNLTLNFDPAQNRFIQLDSAGNLTVNGSVSVSNVAIVPHVWVIKNARFTFNNSGPATMFQVDATLKIPSGALVGGKIKFVNGDLDAISLFADNIRVPLGATGVFLTRIDGGLENLANPSGNPPLKFTGGMGLSFGPRITIPIPGYLGGPITGAIIDLTVNGSIDRNRLTVSGDMALVGNSRPPPPSGLATGTATMTLDWNRGVFEGDLNVNVLGGLFNATVRAQATSEGFFTFQGTGNVRIPDGVHGIGGISLGSGNGALYFSNDGNYSNDFVAGWGTISIPNPDFLGVISDGLPYIVTKGLKVFFDGRVEFLSSEVFVPPIITNSESASFEIEAGTPKYLVTADWPNSGVNPNQIRIQFVDPNNPGTLIDVTQPGNGVVQQTAVTSLQAGNRAFALKGILRTGTYVFTIVPPAGNAFNNTKWNGGVPNEKPRIDVTGAQVQANQSDVTINYAAFDPDDVAKIAWFADTALNSFTGVPIRVYFQGNPSLENNELDRADTVTWKSAEPISGSGITMQSGIYFIYARIDDGVNAPFFKYLNAPVTIDTNSNPHPILVRAYSTQWNQSFIDRLIALGLADDNGFKLYDGVDQIPAEPLDPLPLPWSNIDRIAVRMNVAVAAPEDAARLLGVNTPEYQISIDDDAIETTIVINIPNTSAAEKLLLRLSETITDKYGIPPKPFDGNNDRVTGDPALLRYHSLHGDANRSGTVDIADFGMLATKFFTTAVNSSSGYSPLVDFDGSGAINIFDFAILGANFNIGLPLGAPVAPRKAPTGAPAGTRVFSRTPVASLDFDDDLNPSNLLDGSIES